MEAHSQPRNTVWRTPQSPHDRGGSRKMHPKQAARIVFRLQSADPLARFLSIVDTPTSRRPDEHVT